MKQPDAIFTADVHIRRDNPRCRTDDFLGEQWRKLDWLSYLQKQYDAPIYIAGDLFHKAINSNWLITETIKHFPENTFVVYGDHDLSEHRLENANRSSINTLAQAGVLNICSETHFDQEPDKGTFQIKDRKIAVWHQFTWLGEKEPWPGCKEPTAEELLNKYPQFDLIVTGDHHRAFIFEKDGRFLVNPGCFTRQDAAFADYHPRVYLWYADTNEVEPIYVPIEEEVVSRQHIEETKERKEKITAWVGRVNKEWTSSVSFESNLKTFFSNNAEKVNQNVKQITYKAVGL
jgi:predicted phosphodiesterase